jgi:amylosucrase
MSGPAADPRYPETVARARALLVEEALDHDALDVLARLDRWLPDLAAGLDAVYDDPNLLRRVIDLVLHSHLDRPERLRARDRERVLRPDWFQLPSCIGYAVYADRFAGDLKGVRSKVPYLVELGVTYLHLMPLLEPRPAPHDGGYAVVDYRAVRSDLGTMADLADLADTLHENGIALTLDLIINHVAREHEWARRARAGEERYRAYFRMFPDRTGPDAFEATLPEVFPVTAPGSFTWDAEAEAWVWTTFNSWQWDLDWSNPDVLCEFVEIILFLANRGVDCLRLDAIAFLWKRLGTDSQNQPEVHAITQALRAVARIAAPAVVFKAEAIVAPKQLVAYLGAGDHAGKVSDLAYHNSFMVQIWSALAARDARLMVHALRRFPPKPTTSAWATYLRCHDDIGWAIDDADAAAIGWTGHDHRVFLSDFYAGEAPGSFARGAVFQHNPETGDRRISGTAASLAGVDAALAHGDAAELDLALARLACGHAMVFGFGGVPVIYMGDELALLNDRSFTSVPEHADDNRWLHRPAMPWNLAELRHDPTSVEGRAFAAVQHLGRVRGRLAALHAAVETELFETGNPAVVMAVRRHAAGTLLEVFNVSETEQLVPATALEGQLSGPWFDHVSTAMVSAFDDAVVVPPYAAWWLTGDIRYEHA